MNLVESHATLVQARSAFGNSWAAEVSPSRRRRLRSIILKLDLEILVVAERMGAAPNAVYEPVAGNLVSAFHDLKWSRNQAGTFAIAPAERGRIVSWVASILRHF